MLESELIEKEGIVPKQRLGILLPYMHNPFWQEIESAYRILSSVFGFQLEIRAPERPTPEAQAQLLEQFLDEPCDAWIINPYTPYNLLETLRQHPDKLLFDVGGKMVATGIGDECPGYIPIPTVDYHEQGAIAGRWLIEQLAPNDRVLLIPGIPDMPNSEGRIQGAEDVLTAAGINIQRSEPAYFKAETATHIAQALLDGQAPLPQAVFCANDVMALGVAKRLSYAGRKKDVLVTGVDGIQAARAALRSGLIDATVAFYTREVTQLTLEAVTHYLDQGVRPQGTPIENHLLVRTGRRFN